RIFAPSPHHPHLPSFPTRRSSDLMMRRMIIDEIRLDPGWQNGAYAAPPPGLRAALHLIFVMTQNSLQLQTLAPSREDADRYVTRSEEHTSELQSPDHLVCRLLLEQ